MFRILEIIKRHDLTEEEFSACLDASFKKEIAEESKKLFLELKNDPYRQRHDLETLSKPLFDRMRRGVDTMAYSVQLAFQKERNIENAFYCFLGHVFSNSKSFYNTNLIVTKGNGASWGILSDLFTTAATFQEEHYPLSKNQNRIIETYLEYYKTKKITPTIEVLKKHQDYCILLQKLAEYDWEGIEKIEDDFEYLINFIYALKLYLFCYTEGRYLELRQKNNDAFELKNSGYDLGNNFLNLAKDLERIRKNNLSVFTPNDETPEEFVVRCADYFGIKADEEIKPVANKATQVKEKQIVQAYNEELKPVKEDFKEEA